MEWLDVVLLSRIQFAFTVMFHYLYPPTSIGLGALIVFMEWMYLKTNDPVYESMTKFWVKVFALTFGLGVASGIVMEFEFGTNWATYSRFVGDVFGSALAAEGIFAFFLESGFLAILVFGWDKVSKKVHFTSAVLVALGSMFSAVWIVVANSWQQTPAGFHLVGINEAGKAFDFVQQFGTAYDPALLEEYQVRAEITNFWDVVFNPSSMMRLIHVLLGSYIQGAFLVMSVAAFYILKNRHLEFAYRSFKIALIFACASSILQLVAGSLSAEIVAEHQPAKLAALEGVYKTEESTPFWIVGIPNSEAQKVTGIPVPGGLSFLVHRDFKEPVIGLDQFPEDERPPVMIPFQAYHLMIGLGMYFIGITVLSVFLMWRGKLFNNRLLMWVFVFSVIGPYASNQLGWVAAEVGRQPWIVQDMLKTSDAVSKAVGAEAVLASLILFTLIYLLLFAMFIYILDRKIKSGPDVATRSAAEAAAAGAEGFFRAGARRGKTAHGMMDTDDDVLPEEENDTEGGKE